MDGAYAIARDDILHILKAAALELGYNSQG
jgi:hypothetical protein